jgi:hemolysin activation/secretion protein
MPFETNSSCARVRGCVLSVAIALTSARPLLAAEPVPSGAGDVAQQQLRDVAQRTSSFAGQGYVPSQDVPPQMEAAPPPPSAQREVFSISRIEVSGATVYTSEDLAPLLKDHLGRPNTLAELYALATAVAAKYRADGYPFTTVRVPGQHLVDGRLKLQVVEFSVGAVDFVLDGKPLPTPEKLRPVVADILASRPVRLRTLEAAGAASTGMTEYRVATTRIQRLRDGKLRLTVMLVRPGDTGIAIQQERAAPPAGAQADRIRIPLREISVTGSTVFKATDLAPLYASLLGHDVTLAELRDLARRIQDRYVAAGYFGTTATVPPQVVHDGVVTIEVTELSVDSVRVALNGSPLPPDDLLFRAANAITAEKPVTMESIQRQVYVLNNIPGVLVESVIPPVTDDPNAQVYLRRKPFTFTTAMDNRGTRVAGPLEVGAMVQEDGQLGFNEEIQLLGLESIPFHNLNYYGTQMILPLTSSGLVATAMISHTDVYPGGYLNPDSINAVGDMVSLGLTYPIIARSWLSTLLTLNFDLFNNSSSVFNGRITTSDERSRALRFGTLTTVSDDIGGLTTVNAYYSQGIDALGARPNGNQLTTRPGMELNAGKFVLDVRRDQALPYGYKLALGLHGQRALEPLPSAVVMTFGGVDFGRAYDSGIISGDNGIAGKVQLSHVIPLGNPIVPMIDPYVFYDIGQTSTALKAPGQRGSASAASTGIGSRFATGFGVGGSAEVDLPLTHGATVQPGKSDSKPVRVFFLLFAQF